MPKQVKQVTLSVIGIIYTPFTSIGDMPIQSAGAGEAAGVIEIYPEFEKGLLHLDGFSHIHLLYHLHKQSGYNLVVTPFMDDKMHGIFATRSPKRPAAIGLSTVKIQKVEGNKIYFEGADMLDGTPLIDIKPFFRIFDNREDAVSGWLESKDMNEVKSVRSDDRFK